MRARPVSRLTDARRGVCVRLGVCALLAVCAGLDGDARAHEIPSDVTVTMIVRPGPERLELLVRVPLEAMQDIVFPTEGPGYLEIERAGPVLRNAALRWLANDISVFADGRPLPAPRLVAARASLPSDRSFTDAAAARDHVLGAPLPATTRIVWQQALLDTLFEIPIASPAAEFAIEPRFERLGLAVTTVIRFEPGGAPARVFRITGAPERVVLDPRWHQAALRFVADGVRHILGGADHLLFLLCLVLPFRNELRTLVWIVTAFTAAHSVTLIGSAYGLAVDRLWFTPLVETLIAASIFYMAVENVVTLRPRMRWIAAFGFGLVHGFGFSFALRDAMQFAGSHVLVSLLSFNIGVELGQLLVLLALIPVLRLAFRRWLPERIGIAVVSVIVGHTAWHWMADRYATLREFPLPWSELAAVVPGLSYPA